MRLICPNCGAQYEVDDSVIPSSGRDVQCSNCGHTWFQVSASAQATTTEEAAASEMPGDIAENKADEAVASGNDLREAPTKEEPSALERILSEETLDETFSSEDDSILPDDETEEVAVSVGISEAIAGIVEEAPQATSPDAPKGQKTDESVLSILREEADAEIAKREQEITQSLETQTDLGLENGEARITANSEDIPQQDEDVVPDDAEAGTNARRDLLPDIEEINSTLRPASERDDGDEDRPVAPEVKTRRRRGFRLGFGFVLLLLTLAILAYIYAPAIVKRIPQSQPYMAAYVDKVNGLRLWTDDWMQKAIIMMGGDTGAKSGGDSMANPNSGATTPTTDTQN